jgi:hypothetical protein
MTDAIIEQTLIDTFLTLNEFSGIEYIKRNGSGKPLNVELPNLPLTEPSDKRFFVLSFLPNEPEPAGLGTEAYNRWTGIFQIDVMVPLGAGRDETNTKYDWIAKLFQRGKDINGVTIQRAYRATHGAEAAYYRTVIRVEFTAALPK